METWKVLSKNDRGDQQERILLQEGCHPNKVIWLKTKEGILWQVARIGYDWAVVIEVEISRTHGLDSQIGDNEIQWEATIKKFTYEHVRWDDLQIERKKVWYGRVVL